MPNSPEGYFYLMNVCGELGKPCPDDDHIEGITSCQFSSKESSMGHSLGKLDHQTLRYILLDNLVFLIVMTLNS